MTFVLGRRSSALRADITLLAAISAIVALFVLISAAAPRPAAAASPKITSCNTAISAMNKSLILIAKRRIAVRTAKAKGPKKVRRAKKQLKSAQKQGNKVRAAIKQHCLGQNGVGALDGQCSVSIIALEKSINLKYQRTLKYKKLKKAKGKKAKKRKRTMRTQLKKLDDQIKTQTSDFAKSCGGGSGAPTTPAGPAGPSGPTDTTPPGEVDIDVPGNTNNPTPPIVVTPPAGETDGYTECKLVRTDVDPDEVVIDWIKVVGSTFVIPNDLPDGTYVVTCRYVDGAGNVGPETSETFVIDTVAPNAPTITGPANTNDPTPTYTLDGAGEGEHYECKVGDGEYVVIDGSEFTPQLGEDGTYTITCIVVDAAGNESDPASVVVELDTTAPTGGPQIDVPGTTNDPTPEIKVDPPAGETGGQTECKLVRVVDGADVEIVGWTIVTGGVFIVPNGLEDGTYAVICRYFDEAGNEGPETREEFTVDTVAPGAPGVSGPAGPTNDTTPEITVTPAEDGGEIECRVNGGEWTPIDGATFNPTLGEGTNLIECRQVDDAGNAGEPGSTTVVVDTTAPGAPTVTGPSGATSDTTPSFNLGGAGAGETYECRVDGGEWVAVDGTVFTTGELTDGNHTVECRIVDQAGNTGETGSAGVEIDSSAPGSVTITAPAITNDTTPDISVVPSAPEPGGKIECKVDDGAFTVVTSPFTPTLTEGSHTITCRYVDSAGNTGPESSATVVVDLTPPSAINVTGPSGLTNDNTPTYSITGGNGGTYECKVDGGAWAAVTSPYTTAPLADGAHTVTCRAVDAAGNASAEVAKSITVDATAPVITVTDGTVKWDGTHVFNITSSETATLKCSIDGGTAAVVTSPWTTPVLANGTHTVSCTGTDAAGNVSVPVVKTFGVFKDPSVVSKSGGFQWGLACTGNSSINDVLGCPDQGLTITIPASPNGLTGDYLVDISGEIKSLCNMAGLGSTYTMRVLVDGASVASDSETAGVDLFCLNKKNLAASKLNLSLSSSTAHTIQISLASSAFLSILPQVSSSKLTVSIHH